MPPVRSLLEFFRQPLLREVGLHLGLLAVLLQVGLAVLHVAPAVAGARLEAAWCGTLEHTPDVPAQANARTVCPLCQLPQLGPVPSPVSDAAAPVIWSVGTIAWFREATPVPAGHFARPIQPRGPPPSA